MKLRELRQQRLMTQREVAERSGITVTTLSRIENGKVIPTFKTIRNLAEVFGISPQEMREIVASAQLPLWAVTPPRRGGERGEQGERGKPGEQ